MRRRTYIIYIVLGLLATPAAVWLWQAGYLNVRVIEDLKGGASAADAPPQIYPETIPESEQKSLDLPQTFRHPEFGFSFSYPEGFTASLLDSSEGGHTVLVQNTERKAGFQIHLEAYDDPDTVITAERLARDIPEMKIKEPQDIVIGAAARGLAFIASDTGTREVWFIFGGTLYQLTAPIENDVLLQRVLDTWNFQKI